MGIGETPQFQENLVVVVSLEVLQQAAVPQVVPLHPSLVLQAVAAAVVVQCGPSPQIASIRCWILTERGVSNLA